MITTGILKKKVCVLGFVLLLFLTSCGECSVARKTLESNKLTNSFSKRNVALEKSLKSYELIKSLTSKEVELIVEGLERAIKTSYNLTSYEAIDAYKVIYEQTSEYSKGVVEVSGLLLVPKNGKDALPLVSYQHGTLDYKARKEAPSNFDYKDASIAYMITLASQGFAISAPDYEGYGVAENLNHPYVHAKSLSFSSYEMLVAAKEVLVKEKLKFNDKLFLTGYSEGGGVTMALHQYIERNTSHKVTMSAPGSGPYNLTDFTLAVISKDEPLPFVSFYMWVIKVYNDLYKLNRSWDQYVTDKNAKLLEGEKNPMKYPDLPIDKNPQLLFQRGFVKGLEKGADHNFLNALKDNDTYDWAPKAPITLYYGTADNFVFPLNSTTAKEAISRRGGKIKAVSYKGLNHFQVFPRYTEAVLKLFLSLK